MEAACDSDWIRLYNLWVESADFSHAVETYHHVTSNFIPPDALLYQLITHGLKHLRKSTQTTFMAKHFGRDTNCVWRYLPPPFLFWKFICWFIFKTDCYKAVMNTLSSDVRDSCHQKNVYPIIALHQSGFTSRKLQLNTLNYLPHYQTEWRTPLWQAPTSDSLGHWQQPEVGIYANDAMILHLECLEPEL